MHPAGLRRGVLWALAFLGVLLAAYAVFTFLQSEAAPDDLALMGRGHPGSPRIFKAPAVDPATVSTLLDPGRGTSLSEPGAVLVFSDPATGERRLARALAWVEYNASTGNYDVPAAGAWNVTNVTIPNVIIAPPTAVLARYVDLDVSLGPWLGTKDGWLVKHDASPVPFQYASPANGDGPILLPGDAGPRALVTPADVEGLVVGVLDGRLLAFLLTTSGLAAVAPVLLLYATRARGSSSAAGGPPIGEGPLSGDRCHECSADLEAGAPFCYRCGAEFRAEGASAAA